MTTTLLNNLIAAIEAQAASLKASAESNEKMCAALRAALSGDLETATQKMPVLEEIAAADTQGWKTEAEILEEAAAEQPEEDDAEEDVIGEEEDTSVMPADLAIFEDEENRDYPEGEYYDPDFVSEPDLDDLYFNPSDSKINLQWETEPDSSILKSKEASATIKKVLKANGEESLAVLTEFDTEEIDNSILEIEKDGDRVKSVEFVESTLFLSQKKALEEGFSVEGNDVYVDEFEDGLPLISVKTTLHSNLDRYLAMVHFAKKNGMFTNANDLFKWRTGEALPNVENAIKMANDNLLLAAYRRSCVPSSERKARKETVKNFAASENNTLHAYASRINYKMALPDTWNELFGETSKQELMQEYGVKSLRDLMRVSSLHRALETVERVIRRMDRSAKPSQIMKEWESLDASNRYSN